MANRSLVELFCRTPRDVDVSPKELAGASQVYSLSVSLSLCLLAMSPASHDSEHDVAKERKWGGRVGSDGDGKHDV